MQLHCEEGSMQGSPRTTVLLGGFQGAWRFGMQGCGVRTPRAAAVAAATCGLALDMHFPNDPTLDGEMSVMTPGPLVAVNVAGASPSVQLIIDPL
jgi:hypothetical protein